MSGTAYQQSRCSKASGLGAAQMVVATMAWCILLLFGAGQAHAQFTVSMNATAPISALTFNPFPDPLVPTGFEDVIEWTADTAAQRLEIGQSFQVTSPTNWNVTAIVLPIDVGTLLIPPVPGQPLTIQWWLVLNAGSTTATPFGPQLNGVVPVGLVDGYCRFTFTNPITLTAGQFYAFTIGYGGATADAQKVPLPFFETRQAPDPFPNGRAMFRENTPLGFVAQGRTPPYTNPTDLVFFVLGTGPQTQVPNQPTPGGGIIIGNGINNRGVGGISINTKGILQNATRDELGALAKLRLKVMEPVPANLGEKTALRKVSLRGIEDAISKQKWGGKQVPDAIRYLGGLQRIRYVLVYPELHDIVLAGPAENWGADARGNVVGKTSGRPVMQLDDLLAALRSARQAAAGGISCSIDPTKEGLDRLRTLAGTLTSIGDPQTTAANIEQTLGAQQISIHGVPPTSHFANVLVAADYRMKRIAMGLEPSPLRTLPSFLQMMTGSGRGMSNMLPRWWLEPKYDPILQDGERLAFELRNGSVKAMTEEDFLNAAGNIEHTGKANPMAQRWADLMTKHYDELAVAEPVFGELQNCIDLAIVAALLVKERLPERANCRLPTMTGVQGAKISELPVPKTVDSQASVLRKGRGWVISASGGVKINSWQIVNTTETSDRLPEVRTTATPKKSTKAPAWWWD